MQMSTLQQYQQRIEARLAELNESQPEQIGLAQQELLGIQHFLELELDGLRKGTIVQDLSELSYLKQWLADGNSEPLETTIERFLDAAYDGRVIEHDYYDIVEQKACGCFYLHRCGGTRSAYDSAEALANQARWFVLTQRFSSDEAQWHSLNSPIEWWLVRCNSHLTETTHLDPETNIRFLLLLQFLVASVTTNRSMVE